VAVDVEEKCDDLIEIRFGNPDLAAPVDRARRHVHQNIKDNRFLSLGRAEKTRQERGELVTHALDGVERAKKGLEGFGTRHSDSPRRRFAQKNRRGTGRNRLRRQGLSGDRRTKMKTLLITAVVAVGLAGSALAQQQAPLVQLIDANASIAVLGLTVDQTVNKEVYDDEGNEIGRVSKVLGDDADTPTALVVNTNGRQVLIELASMELVNNRIVVQLAAEEFEGLPAWEDTGGMAR
jgi:rRNA processing protein Gar1